MQVTLSFITLRKHIFYLKQLVQHLHSKKHKRQLKCVVMASCGSLNNPVAKRFARLFQHFFNQLSHTHCTLQYISPYAKQKTKNYNKNYISHYERLCIS